MKGRIGNHEMFWEAVEQKISSSSRQNFHIQTTNPVSGGCINSAYKIIGQNQEYFVKVNSKELQWMFEAEALALNQIIETQAVQTPRPICHGSTEQISFLVLKWVNLHTHDSNCDRLLGQQLAQMHRKQQPYFGWERENAIGSTRQINTCSEDWVEFWLNRRLRFQLELAKQQDYGGSLQRAGETLCQGLRGFFTDYRPRPSLLHGDLWAGNYAMNESGLPIIFDPASYYGDREADIAMTELFGGFGTNFYAAYHDAFPLDPGYSTRKTLYNLYQILNHLHLFGGGYLSQAQTMIDSLVAELR